jgi:hypothetical protein
MGWRQCLCGLALLSTLSLSIAGGVIAGEPVPSSQGRVEVTLPDDYRKDLAVIKQEFAEAGLTNVHIQFMRRGQPPPNIGVGRDVPVERAQAAIRLARKYNRDVKVLLPERLFPATFITIASSNYDDTVDYPIDGEALHQLENPALTSEQFHSLYGRLTSPDKAPARKGRSF